MIGQKIKNKRKELNLTQEYLARELNISRQAVSKWEKEISEPSMENLVKLSEIFGVDIGYFKNEKEEESKISYNWLCLLPNLLFWNSRRSLKQKPKRNAIFNTNNFSSLISNSLPSSHKRYGRKIRKNRLFHIFKIGFTNNFYNFAFYCVLLYF